MNRSRNKSTQTSSKQNAPLSSRRTISTHKSSSLSTLSTLSSTISTTAARTPGAMLKSVRFKSDNAHSHHPITKFAPGLKVNVSNMFDARRDFKRDTGIFMMRYEIDEYGNNVQDDLMDKSAWIDKHLLGEYYQTMLDRYCSSESKKAKQIKPSDRRQALARKHKKILNEQRLVMNIRRAIDNTPEYTGFQKHLAHNKKIYGEYNPSHRTRTMVDRKGGQPSASDDLGF